MKKTMGQPAYLLHKQTKLGPHPATTLMFLCANDNQNGPLIFQKTSHRISGVMFSGILMGHFGYHLHKETLEWLRDAGLILFVYAVGMQVGPSFFSSFKKDGVIFSGLAVGTVLMGGVITIVLLKTTPNTIDNLVGIMSGAVTNTPGLGAAKAALNDVSKYSTTVFNDPANGYALSYPFGVLGAIL